MLPVIPLAGLALVQASTNVPVVPPFSFSLQPIAAPAMMENGPQVALYPFAFHVMAPVRPVMDLLAPLVQAVQLELSYIIQSAIQIVHLRNILTQILKPVIPVILLA